MTYECDTRVIEVISQEDGKVTATVLVDVDPEQVGQTIVLTQVELWSCYNPAIPFTDGESDA